MLFLQLYSNILQFLHIAPRLRGAGDIVAPSTPFFPATIAIQNVVVGIAAIGQCFAILIRVIITAKILLGIVAFMEFFVVRPKLAQLPLLVINL